MILFFHFFCVFVRYLVISLTKSVSKKDENASSSPSESHSSLQSQKYRKRSFYENGTLKFFPPVYIQRYETVALILEEFASQGKIRKVADFGCAELGFFMYLKQIEGITEILEIDINKELLERYSSKAEPLTSDYLMSKAIKPLDVYVLVGNIAEFDDHLIGTDTVIAIELIEHLEEETLKRVPYNIFHNIKPRVAIFTTPNADFNSLFPNFTDLRHCDHKFEWTRKEFFSWTQEIIYQYPEYSVKFYGIGAGPEGTENLGCCSQMAVFQRKEDYEIFDSARERLDNTSNYNLVSHYKYPAYEDNRTREEKIEHEIQFRVPYLITLPDYYNEDECRSEIPLSFLKQFVTDHCDSEEDLRNVLVERGMNVMDKDGQWVLVKTESELNSDDSSCEEDDLYVVENENSNSNTYCFDLNECWDSNEESKFTLEKFEDTSMFLSARSAVPPKGHETVKHEQSNHVSYVIDETKSAPEGMNQLLLQKHVVNFEENFEKPTLSNKSPFTNRPSQKKTAGKEDQLYLTGQQEKS